MTNFEFCRDSIHSKTTESCILLFLCTLDNRPGMWLALSVCWHVRLSRFFSGHRRQGIVSYKLVPKIDHTSHVSTCMALSHVPLVSWTWGKVARWKAETLANESEASAAQRSRDCFARLRTCVHLASRAQSGRVWFSSKTRTSRSTANVCSSSLSSS